MNKTFPAALLLATTLLLTLPTACAPVAELVAPDSLDSLAPAENTASGFTQHVVYVADNGEHVQAEYRGDVPGDAEYTVTLHFADGRRSQLPLAISASGARYAAGDEEWWEHQGEVRYVVDAQLLFVGRQQAADRR